MTTTRRYNTERRTVKSVRLDAIRMEDLTPEEFAWVHLDSGDPEELRSWLALAGVPETVAADLLDPAQPFFYYHQQDLMASNLPVCKVDGDRLVSHSLVMAMTGAVILTAHPGPSAMVDRVSAQAEENFRAVGRSPGFIYFLLWDGMVDDFLPHIFHVDDRLTALQDLCVRGQARTGMLDLIHAQREKVRVLKQSLAPMQRVLRHAISIKLKLINEDARNYLRGLFDHMDRVAKNLDSLQDRVGAVQQTYDSWLAQQQSETLRVLTIIATMMMPLTLIAGVYGMNFQHMPELQWRYGYHAVLGLMATVALAMLGIFRRKKWL